jgi:hypothetical protein
VRALLHYLGLAALTVCGASCGGEPTQAKPTASASAPVEQAPGASANAGAELADAGATDAGTTDAGATDAGTDAGAGRAPPRVEARVRRLEAPEETKSPLPKTAEWTDQVQRSLVTRPEYACTFQHVREWHRITCSATNATVMLVAGTADGVSVWATAERAQLLFPVRRGDRRVFEVMPHAHTVMVEGNYGAFPSEQPGGGPVVLSETWLEGEDAPTLVVQ